ncbi:lipoprotein [Pantoea sp. 1.19]|uniref:LPS translocon maturation chaperone LptM n=1 Tax=Pantoea sp. 1.19 TaxID=1925589 RepID=UPI00094895F3|nr:lipoprotein [Pantoea sp. 1.19]
MSKKTGLLALMLAALSLAGCGLKGPLYFPPEETPKPQVQPRADASTAQPDDASKTPKTAQPGMQTAP